MRGRNMGKPDLHGRKFVVARRSKKGGRGPQSVADRKQSDPKCTWHNWLLQKYPF